MYVYGYETMDLLMHHLDLAVTNDCTQQKAELGYSGATISVKGSLAAANFCFFVVICDPAEAQYFQGTL